MSRTKGVTQSCDRAMAEELYRRAVHSQTQDHGEGLAATTGVAAQLYTAVHKKQVLIPKVEEVQVPVVRKEACRRKEKRIVVGQKLIPVTKYKEVEETILQVKEETVNGRKEKRSVPITKTKKIPFTEYEVQEVEVEVEVPWEEVITRKGYRTDKHVVSQVYDVEQDHVYELRPVLVKKGDMRMTELNDHHKFKTKHGEPVWDSHTVEGFQPPPKTPDHRPDLHRPSSAASIRVGTPASNTFQRYNATCPKHQSNMIRLGSSPNLKASGQQTMQRAHSSSGRPRRNH